VLCREFRRAQFYVVGIDTKNVSPDVDEFIQADLARFSSEESYRDGVLSDIRRKLPDERLTVLLNNAALQILGATEQLSEEAWRNTFDVNVLAPFLLVQQLLSALERARGSVINIGSIHATLTKPGFLCYATSKAALVALTRQLLPSAALAMRLPVVPGELISSVLAAGAGDPGSSLGEQLVLTALSAWDVAEIRDTFLGLLRSAATSEQALVMLREFVTEAIVGRLSAAARTADPAQARYRAALVASQVVGLGLARQVLGLEPLAEADRAELAAAVGPTLDRYLTGDLG